MIARELDFVNDEMRTVCIFFFCCFVNKSGESDALIARGSPDVLIYRSVLQTEQTLCVLIQDLVLGGFPKPEGAEDLHVLLH